MRGRGRTVLTAKFRCNHCAVELLRTADEEFKMVFVSKSTKENERHVMIFEHPLHFYLFISSIILNAQTQSSQIIKGVNIITHDNLNLRHLQNEKFYNILDVIQLVNASII